eukprot:SAG22_NODE_9074_length_611_cov_1.201172_2_plen_55_part_01
MGARSPPFPTTAGVQHFRTPTAPADRRTGVSFQGYLATPDEADGNRPAGRHGNVQ